jgi:hypothetical protein
MGLMLLRIMFNVLFYSSVDIKNTWWFCLLCGVARETEAWIEAT